MSKKTTDITNEDVSSFRINRAKNIKEMYADDASLYNRYNRAQRNVSLSAKTAASVRSLLDKAITNRSEVVSMSKKLYAINPIYASVIEYMANMFMWRYKVTPRKLFTKSKSKAKKSLKSDDYNIMYNQMLEVVDGLMIETKFPTMLTLLYTQGAVYFTTACDDDVLTIETVLLPDKYCRKVGETQYGTNIIAFNFSYFDDLGLKPEEQKDLFKQFPSEFEKCYRKYKNDNNLEWQKLDPHFSSGLLLNDYSIPTYFYILGGILDYEKYQDNELERNENMLKYLVVQKMPVYQDQLVFEMDEVKELHASMKRIIDKGDKTRLLTTFGDVSLLKVSENDTAENQVLSKAFKAIFNNAGFNSGIFTSDSVEALKMSLVRDKGIVWKQVSSLLNFYTIAINNWYDFGTYQADIDILPISQYTYDDDIKVYKENATLGVGKLDYIIATGIKQKDIVDNFTLEAFLKLDRITPMQTSYTQTADSNVNTKESNKGDGQDSKSGIEPTETEKPSKSDED